MSSWGVVVDFICIENMVGKFYTLLVQGKIEYIHDFIISKGFMYSCGEKNMEVHIEFSPCHYYNKCICCDQPCI